MKCIEEKRCNCLEKCTAHANNVTGGGAIETTLVTTTTTTPPRKDVPSNDVSAANSSSHNCNSNSKLNNKDLPRKLDFSKFGAKKANSPCIEVGSETLAAADPSFAVEDKVSYSRFRTISNGLDLISILVKGGPVFGNSSEF